MPQCREPFGLASVAYVKASPKGSYAPRIGAIGVQARFPHRVRFSGKVESTFLRDVLPWVAPALVFFLIWTYLAKRMGDRGGLGGGFISIGKSKAKVYVETDTKVTFDDVAGVDEAKEELREIDRAVRDIARTAFDRATHILTENRRVLEDGARELLQKETLSEAEIGAIAVSLARPPSS